MATTLKQKLARLDFIQNLHRLMDEKHLSVHDIAKIAGCSLPTVERWLDNENVPHPAMQKVLLKELGNIKKD